MFRDRKKDQKFHDNMYYRTARPTAMYTNFD